jgi:hypothetical protein
MADARETGLGRLLLTLLIGVVVAVPLGYWAARAAFGRVFSSFDNHDSAAPVLLAAPVGLAAFLLVSGFVLAFAAFMAAYRPRRSQGTPGTSRQAPGSRPRRS